MTLSACDKPAWRLALAIELDPPDQRLVGKYDKVVVGTDFLVVIGREESPTLCVKFHHPPNDGSGRDFVEVGLDGRPRFRHRHGGGSRGDGDGGAAFGRRWVQHRKGAAFPVRSR